MANICVFCGSQVGKHPEFQQAARQLAEFMAANNHTLVYGGGGTGIMGIMADTMLQRGGRVVGVIPQHLARVELLHAGVADMRITVDMHERKATMHELADAYITLPGGYGTMEELFEAVTWAQLDLHARPIAVFNQHGLYDGLITLLDAMVQQQFLSQTSRNLLTVTDNIDALLGWVRKRCATS